MARPRRSGDGLRSSRPRGAVAAVAAQAVGLAVPGTAEAADGDAVRAGRTTAATHQTGVQTARSVTAFVGTSATGDGLAGVSNGSAKSGVYGVTGHAEGYGVFGRNQHSKATGSLGNAIDGVQGTVREENAAGVRGMATVANAAGVVGENHGHGTVGALGGHKGAVMALVQGDGNTADALYVEGPVRFSRSGIITVPAGERSASQPVANILPNSCVLAMSQTPDPTVAVAAAVGNVVEGRVYVYLTAPAPAGVAVAWWLLEVS